MTVGGVWRRDVKCEGRGEGVGEDVRMVWCEGVRVWMMPCTNGKLYKPS